LTIERAIKSVLDQTYQYFEIIVIDDASKDSELTFNKLQQFNDSRIKFFSHEVNKNGSAARNTGIKESAGKYIALLDSDDEWLPDHLEKSHQKSLKCINSHHIVYCKNIIKTDLHKDLVMPEKGIGENEKLSDYLFCNKGYMSTPSLFAPSFIFTENLFDESLIRHQDYEFLLRLESKNIQFLFSGHHGVIVHWENNDTEKKGGTWDYSLAFAKKNRHFYTSTGFSCFLLKNVIYPLLQKKSRTKALKVFMQNCNPFSIGIKEWMFFLDYLFFGRLTIIKFYSKKKNEDNQ
jgi:glycosyltransferase involved in cell wall biosynthesis